MRWAILVLWALRAFAQSPANLDFEASGRLGAVPIAVSIGGTSSPARPTIAVK